MIVPNCRSQLANGFLIPPPHRDQLGRLLQALGGFHTGVELGVQAGWFSKLLLETWPSCTKYYLVDIWAQQANYVDVSTT
jgi:hypothetical protein